MLIKVNNKAEAFRAVINMWLHDKEVYCNYCGSHPDESTQLCCDNPQVGRNIDHCRGVIKQNKEMRSNRLNQFGSTKDNSIRYGLSLPPQLYQLLKRYSESHGEKFLGSKEDINWFMKKFPEFRTCDVV